MGDPKYSRKVWRKPKRPLNYDLKMDDLQTLGTFGLRTKRELWKAHTELSRVRHQARSLLALRAEDRSKKEPVLMKSLARIGLVSSDATLDDVLNLKVNDLLARRFQTIVTKKFGFKTPYQARQAVVHGHIMVGNRKIDIPSYVVTVKEEEEIRFAPESTIPQGLKKKESEMTDTLQDYDNAADFKTEGGDSHPTPTESNTPAESNDNENGNSGADDKTAQAGTAAAAKEGQ